MKTILKSLVLMGIMLISSCVASAQSETPTSLPAVSITDAQGNKVLASKLSNDGKPMLVSFFATWCGPCRNELSTLAPLQAQWAKETGVRLVIVSLDQADAHDTVMKFVAANPGLDVNNLYFDTEFELAKQMGVSGIPHMLYIDGNGKIVDKSVGFSSGHEGEIIDRVRNMKK